MKTHLRRSAATLTAACALLLVVAAPVSASTQISAVTSGTVTLSKTGQTTYVIDMTPDPTDGCPDGSLVVTSDNTTPTGAVNATITSTSRFFFGGTGATNHYITTITGSSTVTGGQAGTYDTTPSPDTLDSLSVRLTIKIYLGSSGCTPVATNLKCTWNVIIHMDGVYTTGSAAARAVSDTALLNGASPGVLTLGGACAAPFGTYTSATVSVSGLGIHVTS